MKPKYTELKVTRLPGVGWRVLETWHTPYGSIPKNTISNGANVPRMLWWFMSPAGVLFEASIFHDAQYDNAIGTKHAADAAFRSIALDYKTPKIQAQLAYLAVKLFGKGKYK